MSLKIAELTKQHDRKSFDCGIDELNKYLETQARQKNTKNISKTRVLCLNSCAETVIGYYTLTGCSVIPPANHKMYKNYPELLSGVKLAKIAIDIKYQALGYGAYLMIDAIKKNIETSMSIASIGLFVDPKTRELECFYEKYGFIKVNSDLPESKEMWLPTKTCVQLFKQ